MSDFVIRDRKLIKYNGSETHVVIPDGVKTIGDSAFYRCESIKSVVLPNSVKVIDDNAFMYCKNLRSVTLPDSLEEIGNEAFCKCQGVKPANKVKCVPLLGKNAFGGNRALEAAYKTAAINHAELYSACIVTLTNLRKHPHSDKLQCTQIDGSHIIVDDTFHIGQRVVYFPIGGQLDRDFARDNHLMRETDENGNLKAGCLCLESRIVQPIELYGEVSEGLALKIEALSKYTNVDKLKDGDRISVLNGWRICRAYVPDGMLIDFKRKELYGTLPRLNRLKTVVIPWGVRTIGGYAFCMCQKIERLVIPDSVLVIEYHAFEACTNLKTIRMPDSVRIIEAYAFEGCRRLQNVRTSKNLMNPPMLDAKTLKQKQSEVILRDGVMFSPDMSVLIRYPKDKRDRKYTVPNGVILIMDCAFSGNPYLTEVVIPNSAVCIRDRAFEDCRRLCSAVIPPGVVYMGSFVFENIHNVPGRDRPLSGFILEQGVLIRGKRGSVAERYAKDYKIAFEAIKCDEV